MLKTSLHSRHVALGAKMVEFAGYDMPVQYPLGVMAEHKWTREHAGLFDVSHMGQVFLEAEDGSYETAARALEALVPADILGMEPGQQRYSQLLNADGGTIDDLMISRLAFPGHTHTLYLVVNAGCKDKDVAHMRAHLPEGVKLTVKDDTLALIALQGPKAADVLGAMNPAVKDLVFMTHTDLPLSVNGQDIYAHISRSGYTGEDGYEISAKHEDMGPLMDALLAHDDVEAIGLGARDSLRLEAGLIWSIPKHRREDGGYLGAARVEREIKERPSRRQVAILPEGRAPAREHTEIQNADGKTIGEITSGGFGPSVGGPIAIGLVERRYAKAGTPLTLIVRGKPRPATAVKLPFVPHNYHRG